MSPGMIRITAIKIAWESYDFQKCTFPDFLHLDVGLRILHRLHISLEGFHA